MSWRSDVDKLKRHKKRAHQMGGPERVEHHHKSGKLTVRERIDMLADPDSFEEIGTISGSASYEGEKLSSFTPSPMVMGTCDIDGRNVVVNGGDFTVRGGSGEHAFFKMMYFPARMALEWRIPYIRLLDAVGGSVRSFERLGATYLPFGPGLDPSPELLQVAPVVSVVLGSVAGLPAVEACLAHFNVMVKRTSQLFVAGPPVVKAALAHEVTKEELGNEKIHAYQSGVINNVAENEEEAFDITRRFLSYMPTNVWETPLRNEPTDEPDRKDGALLEVIPHDRRRPYDPYQILRAVMDFDSIFELSPLYGRSRITALARINGWVVGAMIDNPNFMGGSMDVAAAEKQTRFVKLCNTFHIPMVYFADQPGFMIGPDSEKLGMLRSGARAHTVISLSKIPWITFIIRRLYGVAGALHLRESGMYKRYAWPSGNWGSMHIEGGAMAAYRREIETAPNPEAKRKEIENRLKALASPFRTAHNYGIEEIIDPRNTRPLLCKFIEAAQRVLKDQLGPANDFGFWP
jgi:acetyl-CoA carboxylase carboxyltransferase component